MDPLVNLKKDFGIVLEQLKCAGSESEAKEQLAINATKQAEWAKREGEELYNQIVADAEYRQWRAKCVDEMLSTDPKMPEWKVKAAIEGSSQFVTHKQLIAKSQMEHQVYGRFINALHDQAEAIRFLLDREPDVKLKK